jgi:hypothetical protein
MEKHHKFHLVCDYRHMGGFARPQLPGRRIGHSHDSLQRIPPVAEGEQGNGGGDSGEPDPGQGDIP